MQDYEYSKRLEDCSIVFSDFSCHEANLNQYVRADATRRKENIPQPEERDTPINSQFFVRQKGAVPAGLEDVKRRLAHSSAKVKIAALQEALSYGKAGFKLIAKTVKKERGVVQLTACDLLWQQANIRGKRKLLKYLSRHPEVCANYIEKVVEPSLIALQEEQEQRRQALSQVCHTQEFIRQQYQQALVGTSQGAIALKAKLDQQTSLVNNLLPDLVLISKLFEAKAKKYLVEAQMFAKAIERIEKVLLKLEFQWQDLENIVNYEPLPLKLFQLLDSLISEMQEHLMMLRQTVARAITTQLQMKHHYNLAQKAATYCEYRSRLDSQEGHENWAHESLVRRERYMDTATILQFSLEQQMPQLETFKCHLFVLQTWLSLAERIKNTLQVGSRSTWVQEAQAMLWHRIEFPYNTNSIIVELERIQQECLGEQLL